MTAPEARSLGSTIRASSTERRIAVSIGATLIAFTCAAAIFGRNVGPDMRELLPLLAVAWSLCNLLTAFLLFAQFYVSGRVVFGAIGSAYALAGLLTWPYIAAFMGLGFAEGRTLADEQITPSLGLAWHVLFPLLAIGAYARGKDRQFVMQRIAGPAAFGTAAAVTLAAAGITAAVYAGRDALPIFIAGGVFQPAYWALGLPLVIVTTLAAYILITVRDRSRGGLALWLRFAILASLLEATLNATSPLRNSYAWDAGMLLIFVSSSIVMVFMLLQILRLYVEAAQAINTRTRRGASRLRALWQIATSEGRSESEHLQMILDTATSHIRLNRDVIGLMSHLEDGAIVIDAIARQGPAETLDGAAAAYAPGATIGLSGDLHGLIHAHGRTCFWHDGPGSEFTWTTSRLRSAIGTAIQIGSRIHFVAFLFADPLLDEPFIESDIAFVDVVASNISHRIHQRKQLERLQYQIEHDSLTGLHNRSQFHRLGRSAVADGSVFGVIVINLDDFGSINERSGQMVGDELLIEIAAALRRVDTHDVVARLGGDDFAVLLCSTPANATLAGRLDAYQRVFAQAFHTGDRDGKVFLNVTASLGAARFVSPDETLEKTMANANVALDHSKEGGGNRGTVFGPHLEFVALGRSHERDELIAALRDDEFVLEYQPTFEMHTRSIAGAEALIRWDHPTRGRLPPAAFLASVKRANLLAAMTTWAVARIARDFKTARLPPALRCYLNVPAQVLDGNSFLVNLEQTLLANPHLSNALGLEITESDAMNKVERAIETLHSVRRLGVLVAIDDFGTGYSSLSYLKRLPIDIVKLDKTFIDGLPHDKNDIALAKMFLDLTRQFGLISVAEGIENESQAKWLLDHGCMIGQGFLFSKPLPLNQFVALVRMREPALAT